MPHAYQHAPRLKDPRQEGAIGRTLGLASDGAETPMIVKATMAAKASILDMASTFSGFPLAPM